MEVILTQALRKVGKIGDVVTVKNGYARNYLIPNKVALRATKANIAYFETVKEDIIKQNGEAVEKAEQLAKNIEGKFFTVIEQAGEDGRLYGSVSSTTIATTITETGEEVASSSVSLQNPIKYVGSYDIEINVHAEVSTNIAVIVARSEEEAKELTDAYKKTGAQAGKIETRQERFTEEVQYEEEVAYEAETSEDEAA